MVWSSRIQGSLIAYFRIFRQLIESRQGNNEGDLAQPFQLEPEKDHAALGSWFCEQGKYRLCPQIEILSAFRPHTISYIIAWILKYEDSMIEMRENIMEIQEEPRIYFKLKPEFFRSHVQELNYY